MIRLSFGLLLDFRCLSCAYRPRLVCKSLVHLQYCLVCCLVTWETCLMQRQLVTRQLLSKLFILHTWASFELRKRARYRRSALDSICAQLEAFRDMVLC
jgi:hypothetical protein